VGIPGHWRENSPELLPTGRGALTLGLGLLGVVLLCAEQAVPSSASTPAMVSAALTFGLRKVFIFIYFIITRPASNVFLLKSISRNFAS